MLKKVCSTSETHSTKTTPSYFRRRVLPTWFATVDELLTFVRKLPNASEVKINCGHATAMKPAIDVLEATREFMNDVVSGKEPLMRRFQRRGTWVVEYKQTSGRFSLICPERLILEAREIM
ncbi:hypothetical protein BS17DRAFT_781324 [Gyrodon lividus]|nr:hypothetical protein BS17DRAFT_781324 [Gyrodon lividus]